MQIPDRFKQKQAEVFQDKTVGHHLPVVITGTLGTETVKPGEQAGIYNMNFRIVTDALKAQEYGLTVNKDAIAKTSHPEGIQHGDYLQYDGVMYRIIGLQPKDSYTAYLCKAVDDGNPN